MTYLRDVIAWCVVLAVAGNVAGVVVKLAKSKKGKP